MERETNRFILCSADKLDLVKTFECGQCFRWNADENCIYYGVASGHAAKLWRYGEDILIDTDASPEFWHDYFDLDTDYAAISLAFQGGDYLGEAVKYGMGIRILRQDPWEALCSFIISQCNNIKRIKGIVKRLCESFGEPIEFEGKRYFAFPDAAAVAALDEDALSCLRCGYRAPYIMTAAKAVASGELILDELIRTDYVSAKRALLSLNGIGEKVANCVVLFGLRHMEAFPIDVWIKRALKEHFPPDFDPAVLGAYAGLAQQYIFYYARESS